MPIRSIAFLLCVFLVSFAPPAKGSERGCHQEAYLCGEAWGCIKEKPFPEEMARKLKLSAEQVRKIEEMAQKAQEESRPLKAVLKEAQQSLKQAFGEASLNEEALMARLSAVWAAKLELKKSHLRWVLAMRQELGPEAWEKLREATFQKKGKKGRRGKGSGKGHSLCPEEA